MQQRGAPSFGLGEILALLSSVALAGALVFGERGLEQLDATTVAGTQIVASFVVALACALVFEPPVNVAAVQPVAWGTIAFLALLSTCLTFMLQNVALTELPSSTVSLLLTGEPCSLRRSRSCCWAKRFLRLVWLAPWSSWQAS